MMTQAELMELLHYDPATGVFTWLPRTLDQCASTRAMNVYNSRRVGTVAGNKTANGYIHIKLRWRTFSAHRLAWLYMTSSWPSGFIDHINGDRLDNRFVNLRDVNDVENQRNCSRRIDNTSGVTGVHWNGKTQKWLARIRVNGSQINLGTFSELSEATAARRMAEAEYGFHSNHGRDRP